MAFTEDVKAKFEAYGWQHILVKDGNDLEAIAKAIEEAKAETDKPSIIEVKTIIGYGAEGQGTSAVHGKFPGTGETNDGADRESGLSGAAGVCKSYRQKRRAPGSM